jgi:fructose-1,6-bisphosphatase/inositol monophosphatase family enzyme
MNTYGADIHMAFRFGDVMQCVGDHLTRKQPKAVWTMKPDGTDQCQFDRLAHRVFRSTLERQTPGIEVLSEEDVVHTLGRRRWIIDGLDGSREFRLGKPLYGTSAGLVWDGELVIGVVGLPPAGECYAGVRGSGVHMRTRDTTWYSFAPTRSTKETISLSLSSSLDMLEANRHVLERFMSRNHAWEWDQESKPTVFGVMEVVRGVRTSFVSLARVKIWDIAASVVLLRELGGVAKYASGADISLTDIIAFKVRDPLIFSHSPEAYEATRALFLA